MQQFYASIFEQFEQRKPWCRHTMEIDDDNDDGDNLEWKFKPCSIAPV